MPLQSTVLSAIVQSMKQNPVTTNELQQLTRGDNGGGVTAAVQAFAQAVPVAERTVWYWLGGRKIHPAFEGRIRQLAKGRP